MRVILVSKAHAPRMKTHRMLNEAGIDYMTVVHNDEQMQTALRLGCKQVVEVGTKTLVEKRNFILDHLVPDDEWFVGMDDNISDLTMVDPDFYDHHTELATDGPIPTGKGYNTWRELYRTPLSMARLFDSYIPELVRKCEAEGTVYGGFATQENPYFRPRKWGLFRFVKSALFVMKPNASLRFAPYCVVGQDSFMSAYVVAKYGCVCVNNWIHPNKAYYEEGGLGSLKERQPKLDVVLPTIIKDFPGLVGKARGAQSALRFLRTQRNSVNQWRKEHGWIQ